MLKNPRIGFCWGKKAPAAISKVGTKLAGFQNAPHRVVTLKDSQEELTRATPMEFLHVLGVLQAPSRGPSVSAVSIKWALLTN